MSPTQNERNLISTNALGGSDECGEYLESAGMMFGFSQQWLILTFKYLMITYLYINYASIKNYTFGNNSSKFNHFKYPKNVPEKIKSLHCS